MGWLSQSTMVLWDRTEILETAFNANVWLDGKGTQCRPRPLPVLSVKVLSLRFRTRTTRGHHHQAKLISGSWAHWYTPPCVKTYKINASGIWSHQIYKENWNSCYSFFSKIHLPQRWGQPELTVIMTHLICRNTAHGPWFFSLLAPGF